MKKLKSCEKILDLESQFQKIEKKKNREEEDKLNMLKVMNYNNGFEKVEDLQIVKEIRSLSKEEREKLMQETLEDMEQGAD